MSFLEKIHNLLDYQITCPESYGAFHIVSLIIIAAITFAICKRFGNGSERTERRIALYFWIILLAFEIYKQLNYAISFDEGKFVWDYRWYIFPFQFCSSPLYILPLIAFLPSCRVREAIIAFLATFSLFAGLAVCIYPNDVYVETLGIDIQTTVHHGSQVILGIFFAIRRMPLSTFKEKKNYLLGSVSVFSAFAAAAMLLNIVGYHALNFFGIDETFNMFYISPYFACSLPLLSIVYDLVPYPVFLVIYLLGFAFVAFIMMSLVNCIVTAVSKKKKRTQNV